MIAALTAVSLLLAPQDPDAQKKKILQDVEKRLKAQEERLLKDIERVIDEELKRGKTPAPPAPAPDPAPAPKAEVPKKVRGYMGVRPGDLDADEKAALKIKSGIKVVEVVEGGPGEKAGLKKDDVITAIDGRAVDSPQEVPMLVQAAGAGAKMKVELLRGGEKKTLEVVLGKHPLDEEQGKAEPDLRERLKKFKEPEPRAEVPKKPLPKPEAPPEDEGGDDFFAFDETMMEQFRGMMEQFGMDPEQFFEQGKDGKYRFKNDFQQLLKGMEKFFKDMPRVLPGQEPDAEPEEAPAPKKPAAKKPAAPRVWLGIQGEDVGDDLRAQLDLPGGVLVADVAAGSPAEKSGLKRSDVILKVEGKVLKDPDALAAILGASKPGQALAVVVLRKGKEVPLTVTLGERKD